MLFFKERYPWTFSSNSCTRTVAVLPTRVELDPRSLDLMWSMWILQMDSEGIRNPFLALRFIRYTLKEFRVRIISSCVCRCRFSEDPAWLGCECCRGARGRSISFRNVPVENSQSLEFNSSIFCSWLQFHKETVEWIRF